MQNFPSIYECDLTDTADKKDKIEDYDENY